ncbi:MAG: prephenate dehydratase domain-containing protein [Lachnospiraceae bacterium]
MGLKNATLEDIKTVYSHPQALSQCRKFLEQHPEWKAEEYLNTAMAAKKVKEDGDLTQAANRQSTHAAQCFRTYRF